MKTYVIEMEIIGSVTIQVEAETAQEALDFAHQEGTNSDGTEGDAEWEFGDVVVMRENGKKDDIEVVGNKVVEE